MTTAGRPLAALTVTALPSDLGPRALSGQDPPRVRTDHDGAPLRCCLRDSTPGEGVVLVQVTPPGPRGAYAERGPVFVHAHDCGGPDRDGYPDPWRGRRQVFRSYDADGAIVGGEVVDPGTGQEEVAARLLDDPAVTFVHARNLVHGCFMLTITRP